ncbi:hypothetical protein GCM10023168_03660 [Fodinibacter luteus]|uniref:Uncharacterized protein n=1 Tax=Fodinibacter luteus TaxID=552064 RepID=A0ABP8JYR6_9MICO
MVDRQAEADQVSQPRVPGEPSPVRRTGFPGAPMVRTGTHRDQPETVTRMPGTTAPDVHPSTHTVPGPVAGGEVRAGISSAAEDAGHRPGPIP